jgi:hypothetical protein
MLCPFGGAMGRIWKLPGGLSKVNLLSFKSSLFNSPSRGRYWAYRHNDIENEIYHNT